MEKVNFLLGWAEDNAVKCGLALLIFHLVISSVVFAIACSPYLAGMHNGHGLWNFSMDCSTFDQWAIHYAKLLQEGGFYSWWYGDTTATGDGTLLSTLVGQYPHVRLISLSYFLFAPHSIAFAPINAFTWMATVFVVYALARVLLPDNRNMAALGTMIFTLMPTYLLQTTQLLKDPLYILGCSLFLLGAARLLSGRLKSTSVIFIVVGMQLCVLLRAYMLPAFALLAFLLMVMVFVRIPTSRVFAAVTAGVLLMLVCWQVLVMGGVIQMPGIAVHQTFPDVTQWLDKLIQSFQDSRAAFYTFHAGSVVDKDVVFENWVDGLRYVPRALQVGLLSPFPSCWFQPEYSALTGARLLAGVETLGFYAILPGFAVFIFCRSIPIRLRFFFLTFSLFFILLLGMGVPNMGAIYRMRYAYLLPIILGGVSGWLVVLSRSGLSSSKAGRLGRDAN